MDLDSKPPLARGEHSMFIFFARPKGCSQGACRKTNQKKRRPVPWSIGLPRASRPGRAHENSSRPVGTQTVRVPDRPGSAMLGCGTTGSCRQFQDGFWCFVPLTSPGVLEYWSSGVLGFFLITPSLHYSITPALCTLKEPVVKDNKTSPTRNPSLWRYHKVYDVFVK